MAIKTITKTCPFCKKVYEQRSFNSRGKTVTDEERWLFGSPLKMCSNCKRLFIDKDMQEIALTGARAQDKALVTAGSVKLALMGLGLGALMLIARLPVFGYISIGVGVACAIADFALYPTRMKKLENERQASEKRLSDPNYARILKKAGYSIPAKYLEAEEKQV